MLVERVRASRSDAWALSPAELAARGLSAAGEHIFAALQRPWRWNAAGPDLSPRLWRELTGLGCELPSIAACRASDDGSSKLLLALPSPRGGEDHIELVHMPREVKNARVTLCVSSQVGCALGCTFCATAELGLHRHLAAGEIVAQVLVALRTLGPRHPGALTLVFMGMGEPLHNLGAVARAIHVLTHPAGLGLSARRITVSTAGLVPQLTQLAQLPERPMLAVSLNATTDALRSEL